MVHKNHHQGLFSDEEKDPLFQALTVPVMYGGVTYNFFMLNIFLNGMVYIFTRDLFSVFIAGCVVYLVGYLVCRKDPSFFDRLWARIEITPTVRNYLYWKCNSYRP